MTRRWWKLGFRRSYRRPRPGKLVSDATGRLDTVAVHLIRRHRLERECDDLGPELVAALSVVARAGPIRMGRLAAVEQVSPSAMSRLISTLEDRGLVIRIVGSRDRRHRLAVATERGRERLREIRAERGERISLLAAKLAAVTPRSRFIVRKALGVLEGLVLPGRHPARKRPATDREPRS